jgi:spermidine/putrescine transport system ATP-binding protein
MVSEYHKDALIDVEVRDVSKYYHDFAAVDNISCSIPQGEFFSLLGPSGCGKTTTLRMIAGFEFPDHGSISIGGEEMGRRPAYYRPSNMVFQRLALFPHMTVFGNIAYGLQMKRKKTAEIKTLVDEALKLVRLEGFGDRRINQISGGQQQRVAIARALVNQPRVLLLDEPLGALDLKLRLQMQLELKRIQSELGTTFIYVTHDQSEALTMSDKIAVMNQGKIVQIDLPHKIYENPRTRFVAGFIGDTNLLEAIVIGLKEGTARLRIGPIICSAPAGEHKAEDSIWVSLRQERVQIGGSLKGLDNIFHALVIDRVYVGSLVKYYMKIEDEIEIVAQSTNDGASEIFRKGDKLQIGWNKQNMILLTD